MRVLDFNDTQTSATTPNLSNTPMGALVTYATEADYVTAKGSAATEGNAFYDTTLNKAKYYNGTSWEIIGDKDDIDANTTSIGTNSTNLTNHEADTSTHGVGEIVGTTEAQTLSTKSIQSPSRLDVKKDTFANLTTYASTATDGQLCFSTDTDKVFIIYSSALTEVGSGSGSGEFNYVSNSDAETNTTDWSTYTNTTASNSPDDFGGGAANITFTRITSGTIYGDGSFRITKDAVNRQGEGVYIPFTLRNGDVHTPLKIYSVLKGSANYVDADLRVYIVSSSDNFVANFSAVEPVPTDLLAGDFIKFSSWFQSHATDLSYRLCFHVASTNADAYTMDLDDVKVGLGVVNSSSVSSDWKAFTPVIKGSTTNPTLATTPQWNKGFYKDNGDTIDVIINYYQESGGSAGSTAGSGVYYWELPEGYSIDTDNLTTTSTDVSACHHFGSMQGYHSNYGGRSLGSCHYYGGGIGMSMAHLDSSGVSGDFVQSNSKELGTHTLVYNLKAKIPVAGRSSNQIASSDVARRDVYVEVTKSDSQSISGGTSTLITFNNLVSDSHTAWNAGSNAFYAPYSGVYELNCLLSGSVNDMQMWVAINGVNPTHKITFNASRSASKKLKLVKGDYVQIYLYTGSASTVGTDASYNYLTFYHVGNGQQLIPTEEVSARIQSTSGQSYAATTEVNRICNDVLHDTHNAYNTTTGAYIVPVSGRYSIDDMFWPYPDVNVATSQSVQCRININGTMKLLTLTFGNGTRNIHVDASTILDLNKGDSITFALWSEQSGVMKTNAAYNIISIHKI